MDHHPASFDELHACMTDHRRGGCLAPVRVCTPRYVVSLVGSCGLDLACAAIEITPGATRRVEAAVEAAAAQRQCKIRRLSARDFETCIYVLLSIKTSLNYPEAFSRKPAWRQRWAAGSNRPKWSYKRRQRMADDSASPALKCMRLRPTDRRHRLCDRPAAGPLRSQKALLVHAQLLECVGGGHARGSAMWGCHVVMRVVEDGCACAWAMAATFAHSSQGPRGGRQIYPGRVRPSLDTTHCVPPSTTTSL